MRSVMIPNLKSEIFTTLPKQQLSIGEQIYTQTAISSRQPHRIHLMQHPSYDILGFVNIAAPRRLLNLLRDTRTMQVRLIF